MDMIIDMGMTGVKLFLTATVNDSTSLFVTPATEIFFYLLRTGNSKHVN